MNCEFFEGLNLTFDFILRSNRSNGVNTSKCSFISLIISPKGLKYDNNFSISLAGNLLVFSDLTFDSCFKIK